MTTHVDISGPEIKPTSGEPAQSLVIFLHGLGADGNDLISLAPYFANGLPHTAFVSPNAPFPCDMAPYGFQWFSLQDRTPETIMNGVESAHPILDHFIDQQLNRHNINESKLALVGFSQGTMMSLHTGLRRSQSLAGIVGYSGALMGEPPAVDSPNSPTPICLIHGTADPIVPFQAMQNAEQKLTDSGYPITTHPQENLEHSINDAGLQTAIEFLAKTLG